jgi:hypothetical protein
MAFFTSLYGPLYDQAAGLPHDVRLVECRGDCCICETSGTLNLSTGMVSRMLAFARDVYSAVHGVRMGMATGEVPRSSRFCSLLWLTPWLLFRSTS